MVYSSNEKGEGILTLSPEEKKAFEQGIPVIKRSGDSEGHFRIEVQLKRPRTREERFRGL